MDTPTCLRCIALSEEKGRPWCEEHQRWVDYDAEACPEFEDACETEEPEGGWPEFHAEGEGI